MVNAAQADVAPETVADIPLQPASQDIWDTKYRLKTKAGQILDETVDATFQRVARALAHIEQTSDKREEWYEKFIWALRHGAIPAGRIISNAGAWEHKPATSTINCTVSATIEDSMDDILRKVHEAGLTLKAGCVAPTSKVVTERGVVSAERAVHERHAWMLCYDREQGRFEMRRIKRHMTTHVPREENIEIVSNGAALKTSIRHPVLVYRRDALLYVRADQVRQSDALVRFSFPWTAARATALQAWQAGMRLGHGRRSRQSLAPPAPIALARFRLPWARIAAARLLFKLRGACRDVINRSWEFLGAVFGQQPHVVVVDTPTGTPPVWGYPIAAFEVESAGRGDGPIGKASDVRLPDWVAAHPQKYFLPFLAGLIDARGTVSIECGSVAIALPSPALAEQLIGLLGLFGVRGMLMPNPGRGRSSQSASGEQAPGGVLLKVTDTAFLARVAGYMAAGGTRERITEHRSQAGQYDHYVLPRQLADALERKGEILNDAERKALGFHHGYHRRAVVSRIWLERWGACFPDLGDLIELARTLRPVDAIRSKLEISETFYDFTVERHSNYLAGENGLMVIHNCGIGYEFSTLRPKGAYVCGAGAYTSGPLSFMDIYDKMCFTVSSAGGRRGAQMATFDVGHPDVLDFIRAKREAGRLRQFNLSLLITDEFMEAVECGADWPLAFPLSAQEAAIDGVDLDDPEQVVWREWPDRQPYVTREDGLVACRVFRRIKAQRIWDMIMAATYDYAEPGFILIDRVNELNNNWFCEEIRATNPCGEQPLPSYGACWTGRMRLNTNYGLIRTEDAYALVQQGKSLLIGVDDIFSKNKTDLRPCTLVRNGEKEVFEVGFAGGQRIELTADHRVYTPDGWTEVQKLSIGSEVHVQARELSHLDLVERFDLGSLKYLLDRYVGDRIVVTRASRRAFLRPLLDNLCVNYSECAKGLSLSRYHAVVREVECVDLANADEKVLRGYLYAAQATAARYKGRPAVYGERAFIADLAQVASRLMQQQLCISRHRKDTYRLLLPDIRLTPERTQHELDLDFAAYGWLMADGWLTDSTGMLFSDQDDEAMRLLAPRFAAMTGTDGALRKTYSGQRRDVYSLACYRKQAVADMRAELGLQDYTSRAIRVPEKIWRADSVKQASFLAAVFCADGGIDVNKLCIRLTSASRLWLEDIQLLLLNFGIHGRIQAQVSKGNAFYSLRLSQSDAYCYYRFIGFPFSTVKQEKLERLLRNKQRWHDNDVHPVATVVSIRSLGVQPVYDTEEFSTHTLIVNGVVVHNCLLGSVNLTKFVREPFTERADFDWEKYRRVVAIFTRMLDNVVEINGLPLEKQRKEIFRKRRHGMGFLGLGSTLTMLRMRYGAADSLVFTERAAKEMALAGWRTGLELAEEKAPAPIMDEEFTVTEALLAKRPEMKKDGYRVGQKVKGRVLWARYSRYMQRLAEVDPDLVAGLAEKGARFTHHSSIAPTGTISLSLANNASNGIEPSFAHHYFRNVIRAGRKSKEKVDVYSFELLAYRHFVDPQALPSTDPQTRNLPDYFITADDITPQQHVDIQAAAQKWIDSSISKTANVPTDYAYEDFKGIYRYAYQQGLKGCTTFRFNPEAFQGVLVKEQDLANTTYRFQLADGRVIEAKGGEEIEYDGELHTAANLYDALKEGYYGKW